MLMFLAALQNLPVELDEAARCSTARPLAAVPRRSRCRMLRPTIFLVITLGLIGTWQVFDQIYVMSQGSPAKTTLTPAFLSYSRRSDSQLRDGRGDLVHPLPHHLVLTLFQRSADARGPGPVAHAPSSARAASLPSGLHPSCGREHPMSVATRPQASPETPPAPDPRRRPARRRTSPKRLAAYALLALLRAGVHLPVPDPARDLVQDRPRRRRAPALAGARTRSTWRPAKRIFGLTADAPSRALWLGNSVLVTVVVTAGRVFFDSLAGYALARLRFRGRGVRSSRPSSR